MTLHEYYPHYLSLHQNVWNRRLHVLGQIATLVVLWLCIAFGMWFGLLLVPFVIYPFAWTGHWLFERNKPAAFKNPLLAKAADWLMFADYWLGNLDP